MSKDDYEVTKEKIEKEITKKWIKNIPLYECIDFRDYDENSDFVKVADVILDNEFVGNKKKRNTLIRFVNSISEKEFSDEMKEWVYIFTINEKIVKIGGTRTGLKNRINSYLCGHHTIERNKSGSCSNTNAFIYNTFEFYLKNGYKIEMFGHKLQEYEITIEKFGKLYSAVTQIYHLYENIYIDNYEKKYGKKPFLSSNSSFIFKKIEEIEIEDDKKS